MSFRDILEFILEVSEEAREVARRVAASGEAGRKLCVGASGDITLEIDREVEDAIVKSIDSSFDEYVIVSEEKGVLTKGRSPELYFIIDPIDGSLNAEKGIGIYSISIAVSKGDSFADIIAGVVRSVVTDDVYYGYRGGGAYLNSRKIEVTPAVFKPVANVSFPRKAGLKPIGVIRYLIENGFWVRILGCASIEACHVASNTVDAFVCFWNTLRVVDIAAAYLILKEAGARIYTSKDEKNIRLNLSERVNIISARNRDILTLIKGFLDEQGFDLSGGS